MYLSPHSITHPLHSFNSTQHNSHSTQLTSTQHPHFLLTAASQHNFTQQTCKKKRMYIGIHYPSTLLTSNEGGGGNLHCILAAWYTLLFLFLFLYSPVQSSPVQSDTRTSYPLCFIRGTYVYAYVYVATSMTATVVVLYKTACGAGVFFCFVLSLNGLLGRPSSHVHSPEPRTRKPGISSKPEVENSKNRTCAEM